MPVLIVLKCRYHSAALSFIEVFAELLADNDNLCISVSCAVEYPYDDLSKIYGESAIKR